MVLPSKPRIVKEEENSGSFEIDGLYPGYGHTLGNSLRRIILSSLPGVAPVGVKIEGISHEFSTVTGVKEDVISILLNLKKVIMKMTGEGTQVLRLKAKGVKEVTAGDLELPGQITVLNPEQHLAFLTDKNASLDMEIMVEEGLGYVSKEALRKDKVAVGDIALDASFTPIRRVNYEVENMRVGNRTDFNRLRIFIETNGTITSKEALEKSIRIMIEQLKAVVGFEEPVLEVQTEEKIEDSKPKEDSRKEIDPEILKTRIEALQLSQRTQNALNNANIRTVGGLARKSEEDILDIDGLGTKGVQEIKKVLTDLGINLR
ncbi:MAG: DNA-directed RNA polymerase subunit alpha [Candidatus Taylorbacteria bacterium RIFCSPLOWO2_02_FULL_43_11]|uniref:DNA-directed RNA polymerase subunit alpha n=1 Tax=Candidatus Taylorbacteria bacterium RIFCSPHIGHO2_02_FULL_43_32b TaxID=1802306 RepID=A0A1G2MEE5_9BACT|nr:MAG: DNA-directed RNA polymerase subunit alpha [Candidatus Taylorbacteria bacterium RIFCSPHIGHO2_01_FULL_43_47]OHA22266.1 MAG: DNA-directed RNA polymerase subunit alpha [Candidatus Taylorbacteria bacterium RIFCSPHIGHO2_02_FULL_43_32b]OHA29646.1 MAG: DNA-directed RNA polymerase subunit alpha [Candidatus Taylorbacteria bacterium RIFCSPLOWO2_01_FULL_43_44]OHA36150.1 MAG: DNA-directed RNA polymerase subunit alpha [Candidatus Taylorbacteria bacterium RIFCSPLOWO2_02_FULL_43_11]